MVSAYISKRVVNLDDFLSLFIQFYQALASVHARRDELGRRSDNPPAVSISDSVTNDYLICLEDGKKLQILKLHLSAVYKMTVDDYKERWGLPNNYPSVAPAYAKRRSQIAKDNGLGLGKRPRPKQQKQGEKNS
jgi:predicted transcriptional regulator